MAESVRIDKWLWCVRIYKTRSMATEACRSGKVTINGQEVKPSRDVAVSDHIKIVVNPHFTKTLEVLELLFNRVGAKLVSNYAADITPQDEYERLRIFNELQVEKRDRGIGRPTKKQRRDIEKLKGDDL
jgi:ribosome-associated heat shock protein Hsp15